VLVDALLGGWLPRALCHQFTPCSSAVVVTALPRSVPYRPRRSRRHQERGWKLGLRRRICPCDSPSPAVTAPGTSVARLPARLNRILQLCAVGWTSWR